MQPGDEIVAARQLYGGSINQFSQGFAKFDWHVKWADTTRSGQLQRRITDKTKALFIESIANPGGIDHRHRGHRQDRAKDAGVPLVVDNTLATPYLIRPIEWGADIVVHSATKFLGGHGNSHGRRHRRRRQIRLGQNGKYPTLSEPCPSYHGMRMWETFGDMAFAITCRVLGLRDLGPALSPMNAFLVLQGIETLPLRMQRHCDNALAVARWLKSHSKVDWVNYAGPRRRSELQAPPHLCAERRRRRVHLWCEGRLRSGHGARQRRQADQPSRQYRRHAQPDHSSRLDNASPARRRASARSPAQATMSCGFRSASRMSRTSSPIWIRRWQPRKARSPIGPQRIGMPDGGGVTAPPRSPDAAPRAQPGPGSAR